VSLFKRLGKSSFIYTITSILQKGIGFFLLPIYTRYLSPEDYGILAVVNSLKGFLVIFFMLSLHGAMTRFYYQYREHPEELQEFWGTILTFILFLSLTLGSLLLIFGKIIFAPIIGDIPFFPFVALGIGVIIFQPFFTIYLALLQTTEQSYQYGLFSLGQFILNLFLAITLVIFLGWDAKGPLTANLVTMILFFIIVIWSLRKDIKFGINWKYLKDALQYCLPLVPHSMAGQISSMTDKIFLNATISTATAGLYNIGFMFGSIMSLITTSINRAYLPISMDVLSSENSQDLEKLKEIGLSLVVIYCLLGSAISLFAKEILMLFTTPSFAESYIVVPLIAFNFVLNGIYYLFVNILFLNKKTTKFIAIATGLAALFNILFNWLLIPYLGMIGAATATMLAQALSTIFVAYIGRQYEKIKWEYVRFILLFLISFSISLMAFFYINLILWKGFILKLFLLAILLIALSYIAWDSPFFGYCKLFDFVNRAKEKFKSLV